MALIKTLRETDNFTFYGVSIDNYAEDQLPFIVYETIDSINLMVDSMT